MATPKTRLLLLIAVPALILLLPLTIYFIDSAAASDKVARNVSISGVDVARYTEEEAIAAVEAYTADLLANTVTVEVNGESFPLTPQDVALTFDTEGAVTAAMAQYKNGVTEWFQAFSDEVDLPVTAALDQDLLDDKFTEWEQAAIPNPAFEGSVEMVGRRAERSYPREGVAINRDAATMLVRDALISGSTSTVALPTATAVPVHTTEDIDAAADRAESIVARGVELTNEQYGFTFLVPSLDLAKALEIRVPTNGTNDVEFSLDQSVITPLIEAARPELEIPPVDASWSIVLVDDTEPFNENYQIPAKEQRRPPGQDGLPLNDTIELEPSLLGTTVNPLDIFAAVEKAAFSNGTGFLPLDLNAEPEFSTQDAEKFGTLYEVSEFTTYMPGRNRADNIRLMVDLVDGTIVWPGQTFSVNEYIGQRTLEKGFKYDCAIVGGELSCEEDLVNVGGGVSQFGTTIFNAIYFGCYEDVVHQPHSIYFSKYPEGREATLGYPKPDVAFKNDSNAPVIIKGSYTDHSVTLTFFGNLEGKTCGTERSERSNVSQPVKLYKADEDGVVAPGDEKVKSKGSKGWSITNWRIFYDAEGNEIKRERFDWRYRGEKNVILLHPCDERVGGDGECPITVPSVSGLTAADATSTLSAAGFTVAVVRADTTDPAKNGIVLSSSPTGYQKPGTTITITVGSYVDTGGGSGGGEGG
ncbi:MAG: VanW family protein [Actinomycetia bacterium]|nr:VanW family protein [Actinomycetes bacterium]